MSVESGVQPGITQNLGGAQHKRRMLIKIVATLFFLISLIYLAAFGIRNWEAVQATTLPPTKQIVLAAFLYMLAHPFVATSWVLGVRGQGQDIPFLTGFRIALTSQVGKYLPGNIAHFFARAGLAALAGVALINSGIATVAEVIAALLAAALIGTAATMIDPAPIATINTTWAASTTLPLLVVIGAISAAIVFLCIARIPAKVFAGMTMSLAVNFVLVGFSFQVVVSSFQDHSLSASAAIGIFTIAWTAGYLVPGAPAGLGVRETVLVAWLSPIIGAGPAIACTVLHRIISACVDGAVGIFGFAWSRLVQVMPEAGDTFSKK